MPSAAIEMLGSSEAGRSWLADLATFLERYGHRGNHWGLQHPTWIEDPTETFATHAAEREAAVIEVHARLQGFPAPAAARRVNKGDILVTISSSPSFTPLFVTEAGGILSHCAVVAREYRIPAVVGLEDARNRITDGQWIEVDGDAGVVRLIDPETVEKS